MTFFRLFSRLLGRSSPETWVYRYWREKSNKLLTHFAFIQDPDIDPEIVLFRLFGANNSLPFLVELLRSKKQSNTSNTKFYKAEKLHIYFTKYIMFWKENVYEPNRNLFDVWKSPIDAKFPADVDVRRFSNFFDHELSKSDNIESTRVFLANQLIDFCSSNDPQTMRYLISFWCLFLRHCPGFFMADVQRCSAYMYLPKEILVEEIISRIQPNAPKKPDVSNFHVSHVQHLAAATDIQNPPRQLYSIIQNLVWELGHF